MEDFLFNLNRIRSEDKITPIKEENELPFLEPIWKDSLGIYYYAHFKFIVRSFALTRIHEHVFTYVGQHEVNSLMPCAEFTNRYYENRLETFIRDGWPQPQSAGKMELLKNHLGRKIFNVTIYCDDLFICPICGTFHPQYQRIKLPWVNLSPKQLLDHGAIQQVIEQHRNTEEFSYIQCGGADCNTKWQRTIQRMKQDQDAKTRVAAYNSELPKPDFSSAFFPESTLPKKAFIYAASSGEHVKIGLTTSVKKRILALQTSSPNRLCIINAWEHYNAPKIERLLHKQYRKFWVSGEWFRLDKDQIQKLRNANKVEDLILDEVS